MEKKLLVLGNYYEPEKASGIYIVKNLYEGLADLGWNIDLIIPSPSRGVSSEIIEQYYGKNERQKNGKLCIERVKIFPERGNMVIRALRYSLIQLKLLAASKHKEADIIYCQSTPPIIGLTAGLIARKKKIPFVYNIHDVFPDSLISMGKVKEKSLIARIGRKIEKEVYSRASVIVTISDGIKENLVGKGISDDKIQVVENWVDTETIKPVNICDNSFACEYSIPTNNFIVLYAGNLGQAQNVKIMIDAAEKMIDYRDVFFVVVGNGSEEDEIKKVAKQKKLDNLLFLPLQPYERAAEVYSIADVSIVTCKKGFGKTAMPSKTWSILATATPIIASYDVDSDLCSLVTKQQVGLCSDPDNIDEFVKNIIYLKENESIRKTMCENALAYTNQCKSKMIGIEKYNYLFNEILNKTKESKLT